MGCRCCKCASMADEYLMKEKKALGDATSYAMSCEKKDRDIAIQSLQEFVNFALFAERKQFSCNCHFCETEFSFSQNSRAHVLIHETDVLIEKQLFQHWYAFKVHRQEIQNEQIEGHPSPM